MIRDMEMLVGTPNFQQTINFNSVQTCPFRTQFESMMVNFNLDQIVLNNTRFRKVSDTMQSSLLDVVVTNVPFLKVDEIHQNCSDHIILDINHTKNLHRMVGRNQVTFNDWRWYSGLSMNNIFKQFFRGLNIHRNDPEILNNQVVTAICNGLNILVPKRSVMLPNVDSVTNPSIQNLKNRKSRQFKKYKRTLADEDFMLLKSISKILNVEIRKERKRKFNFHSNQSVKAFWKSVNHLIGKKVDSNISLKMGNEMISDSQKISEYFSEFFTEKVATLVDKSLPNNIVLGDLPHNESDCDFFTESEIRSALQQIKSTKAQGHDEIPSNVLKDLSQSVIRPLTRLFNLVIETGIIPKGWKVSRIVPVFKSGDKTLVSNYRPVSNISSISKAFEKALISKLQKYLDHDILFGSHQHSYRLHTSTTTACVVIQDYVASELDKNRLVLMYSADLSSAFDLLIPNLLAQRLVELNIPSRWIKCIQNYLTDRSGFVDVNGEVSTLKMIPFGCVQGSVLGPTLVSFLFTLRVHLMLATQMTHTLESAVRKITSWHL